jgi:hypothetical protein
VLISVLKLADWVFSRMPARAAAIYLRLLVERSTGTKWDWQLYLATGAGLCFLVAAVGVEGAREGVIETLSEPRPLDWPLVGTVVLILVILGAAAGFVVVGLRVAGDFLPPRQFASRELRYAVTAVMVPVLAAMALPLLAVTLLAAAIVATAGPVFEWRLARRCLDCAIARQGAIGLDPVFCERHERFFGGDTYRAILSRDID